MKLALCQMNIIWEDKEANYRRTEENIKCACEQKADLLLLPEMSFTGFSMNTDLTKESNQETVNRMIRCARQNDLAIGFGWVRDCGEKSENHYTIVSKDGKIISDYAKIHPFSFAGEDQKFQGGKSIVIFEYDGIKLSTFICYDLRFPEIFQIASKDAAVIIVPANWPKARREHWKCLLQARAIENQVYMIAVNCVGEMRGIDYSGDSCVIDPLGQVVLEASDMEKILTFDLHDNVSEVRSKFPVKKDRRENIYKGLAGELYDCCS